MDNTRVSRTSRRAFLKISSAAGAGLLANGSVIGQAGAKAAKGTLRFGIIGCGAQAEALRMSSTLVRGVRFAAVCDIQEMNRKAMAGRIRATKMGFGADGKDCAYYERAEKMLEKETLDAVIVAVPDFLHKHYTNLCLGAGLHVYCEKPMASTVDDARSMVKAQIASGKLLQIGHQRRSNPQYLQRSQPHCARRGAATGMDRQTRGRVEPTGPTHGAAPNAYQDATHTRRKNLG